MSKRDKLKLFVWPDVLTDYYPGVMFALARDVGEARRMVLAGDDLPSVRRDLQQDPKVYAAPVGFTVWGGG